MFQKAKIWSGEHGVSRTGPKSVATCSLCHLGFVITYSFNHCHRHKHTNIVSKSQDLILWARSAAAVILAECDVSVSKLLGFKTFLFLAVPRQLYRWPCHWHTDWLTHSLLHTFENTTIQHSERLVTLETCDESDEERWPDQQKDNNKDKDNDNDKDNDKYI